MSDTLTDSLPVADPSCRHFTRFAVAMLYTLTTCSGHAARAYHHKVHTMIKHAPFSKNTHLRNISLTAPKSLAYILSTWSPDKHVNFTHTPSIELVDSAKYNGGTNA
eukprot:scaffold25306_cov17-Tisochrysis_lutea.AAC.1